jgi:hypothetical protein
MSHPMEEQETTVCAGRSDDEVWIYTSNSVHLKKLRADSRVAEVRGGDDWGQFHVPSSVFDPLTGFKRQRRSMTEAERLAAAERLAVARTKRGKGS